MRANDHNGRSCIRCHRWKIIVLIILIIAAAIVVPLVVIRPWDRSSSKNGADHSQDGGPNTFVPIAPNQTVIPSKDDTAKCNAYTPALNEPFDYASGNIKMRGVNLGGWLVLEPFITPSLFSPYVVNGVIDEYTLCKHLGPDGSKALLEEHYASWVTEDTFIRIRDLGLNHVRIPIGFWALGGLTADEPYVPNISWTYLLRAIEWARKYGIRVMIELHAAPGSQNGWNHSGRSGQINWINGTDGAANAQRTLSYVQQMATFFSSPDYAHVSPIMGALNEPAAYLIGGEKVMAWYTQALSTIRTATGTSKSLWTVIHDGFLGLAAWADFLPGADRLMLDTHQYIMFDTNLMSMSRTAQLQFACQTWGSDLSMSTKQFGPTMVGEFSVAVNDCATYLNGVGMGHRWNGTFDGTPAVSLGSTCVSENNAATYDALYKLFLSNFFNAQVEAFEQGAGWFYWNFKTESNPLWSYFDGVDNGWIPKDANNRGSSFCATNGYGFSKQPVNPTPTSSSTLSFSSTSTSVTGAPPTRTSSTSPSSTSPSSASPSSTDA
ncbi:glycoside hydrolase superfamily [Gamsiella multidivaricata]|uniref:glycoside hydrolase superfamily n=1 Tax=Gamsiella multidivaricata TaxID=101098 RepID=UPI00221F8CFB|nr:glycoside hydrolase superfamily [Gamsiella multidivaricata]KAG0364226.1 hypothetical protein BGZ54_007738 [Gamsiella multidivaricata]KAI7817168.1 glycoside hydrolase superfamily [Gamsiella multidivaricata]